MAFPEGRDVGIPVGAAAAVVGTPVGPGEVALPVGWAVGTEEGSGVENRLGAGVGIPLGVSIMSVSFASIKYNAVLSLAACNPDAEKIHKHRARDKLRIILKVVHTSLLVLSAKIFQLESMDCVVMQ